MYSYQTFLLFVAIVFGLSLDHVSSSDYSLMFDGVTNYVSIPPAPQYEVHSHTVEAWTYATGLGEYFFHRVFDQSINGKPRLSLIHGYKPMGSTLFILATFFISGGSSCTLPIELASAPAGWTHSAYTFNHETRLLAIYLNGTQVYSGIMQDAPFVPDPGTIFSIGGTPPYNSGGAGGVGFPGLIDNVRFWNFALSPEHIAKSFQQPLTGKEEGLIGYWRLTAGHNITKVHDFQLNFPANDGEQVGNNIGIYANLQSIPSACTQPACQFTG